MTRRWMRFIFAASLAAEAALAQATPARDLEELIDNERWAQAAPLAGTALSSEARRNWLAARVRFAYHDFAKAAELAEKAAAADPKNADYQFLLFEIYGSQAQHASVFSQLGLARKCRKAVDTAVALDPKHIDALLGLMQYLYRAPSLFGGDKTRALAIPGEIGKFNPARGHLAQAVLDLLESNRAKARENYRLAVSADPNWQPARVLLSRSLSSGDAPDLAQAELHAREAVRINPKRADGWDALGYALGRQGKTQELEPTATRSGETSVLFYGSRGLLDAKKKDQAATIEQLLRQYLKQPAKGPGRPSLAVARLSLAIALEQQGRKPEAIAEMEIAAKLDPKHPAIQKELKRLRS